MPCPHSGKDVVNEFADGALGSEREVGVPRQLWE